MLVLGIGLMALGFGLASLAGEQADGPVALVFIPLCVSGWSLTLWGLL